MLTTCLGPCCGTDLAAPGRTVAIQLELDSQSALLQYLGFLFRMAMGHEYQNKQVP